MKTYSNDNNLLCVEEDGERNFYDYNFLLQQKVKIEELRVLNDTTQYPETEEQSSAEAKQNLLSQRDAELNEVNELISQAEKLNCK